MTEEQYTTWRKARWRARTDLRWFCNEVLGYPDINEKVHHGLINVLQKFPKPTAAQFEQNDVFSPGKTWIYTPCVPLKSLLCSNRVLILDFRGAMKSTVNVIAHTIQWIINYPDITILIVQANTEKAKKVLREIKAHFTGNQAFRDLFPEHCPKKKVFDWGTQEEMITEARPITSTRKEPTVGLASVETGVAGMHYDVIKFTDIVEQTNSADAIQCRRVYDNFLLMLDLLVAPTYWVDVEGTRYSFADAYGEIIDDQRKLPPDKRTWKFYLNSCFERDIDGPRTFGIEELDVPYKKDENGKPVSRWPERFPLANLLEKQRNNARIFSCQQLNNPIASSDGREPFPITAGLPVKVTPAAYRNVRIAYREIIVDTAETDTKRSDYSAITVGAWDTSGRLFIEQIYHGRYLPNELIRILVNAIKIHRPRSVGIEETAFVRGLKASLGREMHKNGLFIPLKFIKRDNSASKIERISNTLQPWYMNGDIRFVVGEKETYTDAAISDAAWLETLTELQRFPNGAHDDILDTLADFFQGKTWFGREGNRPADHEDATRQAESQRERAFRRLIDLEPEESLQPGAGNHRSVNGLTTIL